MRYPVPFVALTIALCLAIPAVADVFNLPSGETSLPLVTGGDPGNATDVTLCGAAAYVCPVDQCDVTVPPYVRFLDVVASRDTDALFSAFVALGGPELTAVTGNPEAAYANLSESQWYNVACDNQGGVSAGCGTYRTESNTAPGSTLPDAGNCAIYLDGNSLTDRTNDLTAVGAFTGGDSWQPNEAAISMCDNTYCGACGGDWNDAIALSSSVSDAPCATTADYNLGFGCEASLCRPGSRWW